MNNFIMQGQCRVCGQLFCCRTHQLEHENSKHLEYADQLKILPVACRRCCRILNNIYELNTKCLPWLPHILPKSVIVNQFKKENRKRALQTYNKIVMDKKTEIKIVEGSIPSSLHKHKKKHPSRNNLFSNVVLVNLSNAKVTKSLNLVFSPEISSVKSPTVKSSTPLTEETKENISLFVESSIKLTNSDFTSDSTSVNFDVANVNVNNIKERSLNLSSNISSFVLQTELVPSYLTNFEDSDHNLRSSITSDVSLTSTNENCVKYSPPLMIFDVKNSNLETSDYKTPVTSSSFVQVNSNRNSTPYARMTISFSERKSQMQNFKIREVTFESYTNSPELAETSIYSTPMFNAIFLENESINIFEISVTQEQETCLLTRIAKKIGSVINVIPKTIVNMWDWSQHRLYKHKRKREANDCDLHQKAKRAKFNVLPRRPVWVNALIRQPLWSYKSPAE